MDVVTGRFRGWSEVVMRTPLLAVHIIPEKGADIRAIVDRRTGVNVLFEAPWGLQPPGASPREGWMDEPFLANYEGGWQELLPNTNDRCVVDGIELPFHGEVATLPWSWSQDRDAVTFEVSCHLMPLRLRRRMTAEAGRLTLTEQVTNEGSAPLQFTWGHHCVLGPPLVTAGARMEIGGGQVMTPSLPWEETSRLKPGQLSRWPHAKLRAGGTADLRVVPGPDTGSHDDVFITQLDGGWAEVVNPTIGLGFRMEWDPSVFQALVSWQPFGGARGMPLAGAYALGIEPWRSHEDAASAVRSGRAIRLAPQQQLETSLTVDVMRVPCQTAVNPPSTIRV